MKKNILSILCVVALITPGVRSALAESVAVEGNSIFILDGSRIVVKNLINPSTGLPDGSPNLCFAESTANTLELVLQGALATDIVIKSNTAVITTYNETAAPPASVNDVQLVDVTSCLPPKTVDLSACYATVEEGKLVIPCLKYGDDVKYVVLGQRGNSMNYEFEYAKPGKSHGHDDDD